MSSTEDIILDCISSEFKEIVFHDYLNNKWGVLFCESHVHDQYRVLAKFCENGYYDLGFLYINYDCVSGHAVGCGYFSFNINDPDCFRNIRDVFFKSVRSFYELGGHD